MRKFHKIAALLLALTLFLGLTVPAFAAGEPQRGVLTYTEAVAPQYEDAGLFIDGLAPVKKNGKWGYIDETGKVVIGFQYDYAWRFNEGYAVVAKSVSTTPEPSDYVTHSYYMKAEIGFIDQNNHYTAFIDPYADHDSDWNYIPGPLTVAFFDLAHEDGEQENFMPGDQVWLFHNGMALINYTEPGSGGYTKGNIFKTDGSMVVPHKSGQPTGPLNEGLIPLWSDSGFGGYMDANGNSKFFEKELYGLELETSWGIDQNSRHICYTTAFNQGLAVARQEDNNAATGEITYLYGFIDRNYNWVIQPQYTDWYWKDTYRTCEIFGSTGLAAVADINGRWGAINKKGETVIPFQYELLSVASGGLIMFRQDGKYGYLDAETHKAAIPARYEAASMFSDDLGLAAVYDGQKAFLIDRDGKAVPGADSLDSATYFNLKADGSYQTYVPDSYVVIEKNGKYGYGKIDYLPELPKQGDTTGWAHGEVVEAIEADLVPVYLQNLYTQDITRAEFCDLIVQTVSETLGKDVETLVLERSGKTLTALRQEYKFNDTASANVAAAYALGIVKGYSGTTFNPYGQITRQEAATMLARTARVLGLNVGTPVRFADAGKISSWAAGEVDYISGITDPGTGRKVMGGVGSQRFDPLGGYTREQAIATALRLFHCVGE